MNLSAVISFAGALTGLGLAVSALRRDPRSFAHRTFAAGILLQTIEAVLLGVCAMADSALGVEDLQYARSVVAALIPGTWLLFSLGYARADHPAPVRRWRWILLAAFLAPLLLPIGFREAFFSRSPVPIGSSEWVLPLGWSGYRFHLLLLLLPVLVLVNLEHTLRASVGRIRWQIKFVVVGLGGLLGVRLYTESQTLLFRSVDAALDPVYGGALVVTGVILGVGLARAKVMNAAVYPSSAFLYRSVTVLIVGVYLLAVGVMSEVARHLGDVAALPVQALVVLVGLIGLAAILLSDRVRLRIRGFVSGHLKRPLYDYRHIWTGFTEKTRGALETADLSRAVVRFLSETLNALSVSIWLWDEKRTSPRLSASTCFTDLAAGEEEAKSAGISDLLQAMEEEESVLELGEEEAPAAFRGGSDSRALGKAKVCYCVAIRSGGEFLGALTLADRVKDLPLSLEEMGLLKVIADQVGAALQNIRLSERLRQAREMEAFQSMSAFVMHDLKNLANKLSLTAQNLSVHFENPDFRKDAERVIAQSVGKINDMCTQLSLLRRGLQLQRARADLNEIVRTAIGEMEGTLKVRVVQELHPVPSVEVDREQMQKVLGNLLLNANDAIDENGTITMSTETDKGGDAVLTVRDNGCGMSREFVETSLFRAFRSTKRQGMGIGLFHCRAIVEAHGGRIEAESEEGKGTTLRVRIPVG